MNLRRKYMVGSVALLCSWMGCSPDANAQLPIPEFQPCVITTDGSVSGLEVSAFLGNPEQDGGCPTPVWVAPGPAGPIGNQILLEAMQTVTQEDIDEASALASHSIDWIPTCNAATLKISGASTVTHRSTSVVGGQFFNVACAETRSTAGWQGNLQITFDFSLTEHARIRMNTFRLRSDHIGGTGKIKFSWELFNDMNDIVRMDSLSVTGIASSVRSAVEFELLAGTYKLVVDYSINPVDIISTSADTAGGVPEDCWLDNCSGVAVDEWTLEFTMVGRAENDCQFNPPATCEEPNGNGTIDVFEILSGDVADCNENLIPDECEIACSIIISEGLRSCWHKDEANRLLDMNNNGILDSCEVNVCNSGEPTDIIATYMFNGRPDCNQNFIPDNCDIASGYSSDCDVNGIPDECDVIPSSCDPDYGLGCDNDNDGILFCNDTCLGDISNDGCVNVTDFLVLIAGWGAQPMGHPADMNCDGSVNVTDLLNLLGSWGDCPGTSCTLNKAFGVEVCTTAASQCQLPDFQLHGDDLTPGGSSDEWEDNPSGEDGTIRHADDFIVTTSGAINQICWWGYYGDGASTSDCFDPLLSTDDFTITFYAGTMHPVLNRLVPDEKLEDYDVSPTRISSGIYIQGGQIELFQYTAVLPQSFAVTAGQCYWIEITNETDNWGATTCHWWWAWSDDGNGSSMRQHFDLGEDYLDASQTMQDADLSFCLDIDWGAPNWFTFDDGSSCFIYTPCFPEAMADCNSNGIKDWCDINRGTSQDANADGIPDECQTP